jgi:hypothetical protein
MSKRKVIFYVLFCHPTGEGVFQDADASSFCRAAPGGERGAGQACPWQRTGAGNARVCRGVIQLAWRFLMFQKESALAQWCRRQTTADRGTTRWTMIVALGGQTAGRA